MLRGRRSECGELDRLLDSVRGGASRVLVLHTVFARLSITSRGELDGALDAP